MSNLRSLLLFAINPISPSLSTLPSGLRLLRVLDFEGAPIVKLPDELGRLFNLRYLNLKSTSVKELPKSIKRLHNLQTLNISNSNIEMLPSGITKLQNLRHLIMYRVKKEYGNDFDYIYGTKAPSDICKLKNLQVLSWVEVESGLLTQARNMTQLRTFGITKMREIDEENLCNAVQNMKLLRYLGVVVTDEEEHLRMDALSTPPPGLEKLVLGGKLEKVPHWFPSLQTLTVLSLHWSRLREDPLPHIQALPNLGRLVLTNAYTEKQLCFTAGFPKLTILEFINLPQLHEITIRKGVMPGLLQLWISTCEALKLPCGIEHLTHLQELNLISVSSELLEGIRGEESVDRPKVRHIPVIKRFFELPEGRFHEVLS